MKMLSLYEIPYSTNVERVRLALAHKGLEFEPVPVDPADRGEVVRISGQELVPVLVDGDELVVDSMEIVRHLERLQPDPPLFPADPARRAEMDVYVDWFNRVWKVPPNEIEAELKKPRRDEARIARLSAEMAAALDTFEAMLAGRDHLMGDDFSAADLCAFPFVKYALLHEPDDDELFHLILRDHQPLGDEHARLADWIRRVDERPR